jgi:hypothetical protein
MLDQVTAYFLTDPNRLVSLGRTLLRSGGVVVVAGLWGRVAIAGVDAALGPAGASRMDSDLTTLVALYPDLPTWWVPETVLGFLSAALIMLSGAVAMATGRQLRQHLR